MSHVPEPDVHDILVPDAIVPYCNLFIRKREILVSGCINRRKKLFTNLSIG